MNLLPMHDTIIVRRCTEENKTAGGIVLPDCALEPPDLGEVLAVGPGRMLGNGDRVPMNCQVGDIVMFGKYCGSVFTHEGEKLHSINERDIVAIMEKTA